MSNTVNIVLSVGYNNIPNSLKDWCNQHNMSWPPESINYVSGGTKDMESQVYCWGVRGSDDYSFKQEIARTKWEDPSIVQLLIMRQEDIYFSIYQLTRNNSWVNLITN